ncbi:MULTISPECIES: YxcD family protein [Aneurinibacillus]|uniref:YxcD family protein n=1 Tax=Aneurinibacillus thermoaerophilus TaxID=143495 RepID=A0A1G7YPF0_ANETH|nr:MULTISPECIES: YxcD family protein [Aneurinibacillus]AMA73781.1 hypothetical protein ACH33_13565 [Aneurinibacillus sp. XH2]MED0677138.1 YxcD family protein [Aneurinibacillus thermoaerophilus]MED0679402.1 YxcD family protein [Aneurinibacillus thermoaerophilus]MED0738027.1 YxcD family protein [Aneurinibacillus thermoaerophilus]MED0756448.1 YxcD family protein [Aneurinibacillus thermoaerophilus]
MEKLKLSEQEIVNALCLYIADKKQISPHDVSIELMWDDEYGFSASATENGHTQILIQANMIEAIRFYLHHELNRDPFAASLELELDDEEGIIAFATYRS